MCKVQDFLLNFVLYYLFISESILHVPFSVLIDAVGIIGNYFYIMEKQTTFYSKSHDYRSVINLFKLKLYDIGKSGPLTLHPMNFRKLHPHTDH